ncbi:winged helix-turn-helix transcriptional regulator [Coraliomargarita parva]|uniref:winged helix-turn-helix transcriptional regulator n=1 Tax=Coraliomargarita parva TaxID=3014050 RepID=UPI0022B5DCCC|nr:winged helix-turn-helix transcriptional regulator [Coraliomargarita parva]
MPADSTKNALPALDRGLHILDQLIREGGPLRYNELRSKLPGIQDSTLARILKALETYGYIHRAPDQGYSITQEVRNWGNYLGQSSPDLTTLAQQEVDRLVEQAQESAAVVLSQDQRLTTIASRTQNNGIQILSVGGLLHFEADHAAAISVLAELPTAERKASLQSATSRFPEKYSFTSILNAMKQADGCLIDQSLERPGVCRIARAFKHGPKVGAVFYCLTQEACRAKQAELGRLLDQTVQRLQECHIS